MTVVILGINPTLYLSGTGPDVRQWTRNNRYVQTRAGSILVVGYTSECSLAAQFRRLGVVKLHRAHVSLRVLNATQDVNSGDPVPT